MTYEIQMRDVPELHVATEAHREAFVRVTKAQVTGGHLGAVYEAIEKEIGDRGLTIAAAPREVYWTDFMAAAADDEVFDVAFPVAGTGA